MGSCSSTNKVHTPHIPNRSLTSDTTQHALIKRLKQTKDAEAQVVYIRRSDATPAADLKLGSPDTKSNSLVRIQEEAQEHEDCVSKDSEPLAVNPQEKGAKKKSPYFLEKNFTKKIEKSKILKPNPVQTGDIHNRTEPVCITEVRDKNNKIEEDKTLKEQKRLTKLLKAAYTGMPGVSKLSKKTLSSTEKSVTSFPSQTFLPMRRTTTTVGRGGRKRGTFMLPSVKEEALVTRNHKRISSLIDFHEQPLDEQNEIKPKGEAFRLQLFGRGSPPSPSLTEARDSPLFGHQLPQSRGRLPSVSELAVPLHISSLSPRKSSANTPASPEDKKDRKPQAGAFAQVIKKPKKQPLVEESEVEQFKKGYHPAQRLALQRPKAAIFVNDKFVSAKF